jgi:hypothetical protein
LARLIGAYRYLYYSDRIEGWMYQTTGLAMMELLWLQESASFAGDIAEIGVHHGCSALALVAAARENETIFAIDVFDRQDLNIDGSGKSDLAAFREHLRYLFPKARVEIIAKSSLEIRGAEQENNLSDIRFLSIDGGHTKTTTLNDLAIAEVCLAPQGAAALDDVFNANWPGVASGLFEFLNRKPDLTPFAVFPNKLFLCRNSFKDFYRDGCRDALGFALEKRDVEFQDNMIDVYGDCWPMLTRRFSSPDLAAAVAPLRREIDENNIPIKRHLIARPGDTAHMSAQLNYLDQQLQRERRRSDVAVLLAEEATARLDSILSSTSWQITAPLRWIKTRSRRP